METTIDFLIGTYSHALGEEEAGGDGIHTAAIDTRSGEITPTRCLAHCVNPSYLAWGPGRKQLYATREVFAADKPAVLRFAAAGDCLQSAALDGELPCHVAVDESGRFLTSAQYGSGNVVCFRLGQDGAILEPGQLIQHSGRGPNPRRQEGPHAHYAAVLRDGSLLVAIDLGIDAILAYTMDPVTGRVNTEPAFCHHTAPGSGPRHLVALSGTDTVYVYCELSDDIVQLELTPQGCQTVRTIRAFERDSDSEPAGAAIRISPDRRHLYVSGRSQSQIAAFAIDPASGELTAVGTVATGGNSPRDFAITPDGRCLVVANQASGAITSLRRDPLSGMLQTTGHSIALGSPVCILF